MFLLERARTVVFNVEGPETEKALGPTVVASLVGGIQWCNVSRHR